jgi:hypothetical protein
VRASLRGLVGVGAVLGALAGSPPAHADPSAQALFDQGLKEMLAGSYESGCGKIAQSYGIDPQPGAVFTLAACYARWGKVQSAVQRYEEYLAVYAKLPPADAKDQADRAKNAQTKLDELRPQVPTITVALSAAPAGTRVEMDGAPFEVGSARAVDPGRHAILATTPSGERREEAVEVGSGEARRVEIAFAAPSAPVPAEPQPTDDGEGPDPLLIGGFVAAGLGVAGLVVGGVTGGLVLGKKSEVDDNCVDTVCNADGLAAAEDGKTLGTVSTVGFVVGGAGVAAAVVLFVVATQGDDGAEAASAVRVRAEGIEVVW